MTTTAADFYEPIMECAYYFYKGQHQRGTRFLPLSVIMQVHAVV